MLIRLFRLVLDAAVELTATFVGGVLEHHRVKAAAAALIAAGLQAFLEDPQLDEHVRSMTSTLSRNQPAMARLQGQELPRIVGSFLQGVFESPMVVVRADDHDDLSEPPKPRSVSPSPQELRKRVGALQENGCR